MKILKIDISYIIISDLKKMLEKLVKELEKTNSEQGFIIVESNIGGNLSAEYNNEKTK